MDITKVIEQEVNSQLIQVAYVLDLPVTMGEGIKFITPSLCDSAIRSAHRAKLIDDNDLEKFMNPNKFTPEVRRSVGFVTNGGVCWEQIAIYDDLTEHYIVIRYRSPSAEVYFPSRPLFRFQGSNPAEDAKERSYVIRDLDELRNIIRADAAFFTNTIYPITIQPLGYDVRTNWCTYVVNVDGCAVGYTNFPLNGDKVDEL